MKLKKIMALAFVFVLAACGSDGGGKGGEDTTAAKDTVDVEDSSLGDVAAEAGGADLVADQQPTETAADVQEPDLAQDLGAEEDFVWATDNGEADDTVDEDVTSIPPGFCTDFGPGFALAGFGNGDELLDMVVQPDGKVVAVGITGEAEGRDIAMVRFNTDGTLDDTFGTGGKVQRDLGASDIAWAVTLQKDGKIVVAGATGPEEYLSRPLGSFVAMRFETNGALDTGFGTDGKFIYNYEAGKWDTARDVAIMNDGGILLTGTSKGDAWGGAIAFLLLNKYGVMQTLYTSTLTGTVRNKVNGLYVQPDTRWVVYGNYYENGGYRPFIARYDWTAAPDLAFGTNGWWGGSSVPAPAEFVALGLQSTGQMVLGGASWGDAKTTLIARFSGAGVKDTTFKDSLPTGAIPYGFADAGDEKLYVTLRGQDKMLTRLLPDGSIDTTFGDNGFISKGDPQIVPGPVYVVGNRLLVGGYAITYENEVRYDRFGVACFKLDGK